MTLAPRSWPSRPALAMTIRSGRFFMVPFVSQSAQAQRFLQFAPYLRKRATHAVPFEFGYEAHAGLPRFLEHRAFGVATVNLDHRVDDFAFGAVGVDAIDQVRHEIVLGIAASALEPLQRLLRGGVVATGTH